MTPISLPAGLTSPNIRLHGTVDAAMYGAFRAAMDNWPGGDLVVAISTLGGDPEVGRLMGEDIRLFCQATGNNAWFLGRVAVYSAGATFMSYFRRENRFLTHGTRLMVHERQITWNIHLEGPLRSCVAILRGALHEIEESIRIEEEGFANIIAQSGMQLEDVRERAHHNWYISADEARALGLIAEVI